MEKETKIIAGMIVQATAGRDEGKFFAVLGTQKNKRHMLRPYRRR